MFTRRHVDGALRDLFLCRSLREGAAGSGQEEVEETEDVHQEEDAESVLQRVLHLRRHIRTDPGERSWTDVCEVESKITFVLFAAVILRG